jgi:Chaperone of endosialidase
VLLSASTKRGGYSDEARHDLERFGHSSSDNSIPLSFARQAGSKFSTPAVYENIQSDSATGKFSTFVIAALLAWIELLPNTKAISPAPDGGYPGGNTAEGQNALFSLSTGTYNTAGGLFSLMSNQQGQFNTGVGAGALLANVAHKNTAIGAGALLSNKMGFDNTANGTFALFSNTTGSRNTATGVDALLTNNADFNTANGDSALASNTAGEGNIALGGTAFYNNTMGDFNTATGYRALLQNTTGSFNTASGKDALFSNNVGSNNTATGLGALLSNTTGGNNTANGVNAPHNNTEGDNNTALGLGAGFDTTGSGNVRIGAGVNGVAGESNITRIRNVYDSVATERAVYVTSDNRIGTLSSSRRYKEEITPMDMVSEAIYSLTPVSFRYKKKIDSARSLCFGLIAEEVAEVNPNLVTLDCEGKPQTVRYEAINAMLLNEFLKEHRKVQEQAATIAQLKNEIANLAATVKDEAMQIKKATAQLEVIMSTPQMAVNDS